MKCLFFKIMVVVSSITNVQKRTENEGIYNNLKKRENKVEPTRKKKYL